MSLSDYVLMPGYDYKKICDAIRNKAGTSRTYKANEVAEFIENFDYNRNIAPYIADKTIKTIMAADVLGATKISAGVFKGCVDLVNVQIPGSVVKIEESAFENCTSLSELELQEGLASIGKVAFRGCSSLKQVTLPSSVETISERAFYNCTSLERFCVSEESKFLSSDDNGVLFDFSKTTLIQFPIGSNLSSYILPKEVTTINSFAFDNASTISAIALSKNITNIKTNAFKNCLGLKNELGDVYFEGSEDEWETIKESAGTGNDCLFSAKIHFNSNIVDFGHISGSDGKMIWSLNSVGILSISRGGNMPNFKFENKEIVRPWNKYLDQISAIEINDNVTSISSYAFRGHKSVASLYISGSVNKIDSFAFEDCDAIAEIIVPDSVMHIGIGAFRGCSKLERVDISNSSLIASDNGAFVDCESLVELSLPSTCVFSSISGCSLITSFTIPAATTTIMSDAFSGCSSLNSVIIYNTIESINEESFSGCENLSDVYFTGTQEEWLSLSPNIFDKTILKATVHYDYIE